LAVLQVDVMNDLGDRTEGAVLEPRSRDEDLEGALVTVVGELRLEHVEADLARLGTIPAGGNELEPRVRVDEATDEPGARDPVDVDALPGDPRPTAQLLDRRPRRGGATQATATLELAHQTLRRLPTRGAEEVDPRDGRKPPTQTRDVRLGLQ